MVYVYATQKYPKKKSVLTENSHLANKHVCGCFVIILMGGGGTGVVQMQSLKAVVLTDENPPEMFAHQTSNNMVKAFPDSAAFLFSNTASADPLKLFLFPYRLLVGAPREKAFPSQQANRTGGLYSCDITSSDTGCTRVVFDEDSKFLSAFIMQLSDFSDLMQSFPLTAPHSCFSRFVHNLLALECDRMCRHCHL